MNWLTDFVRPKIKALVGRKDVPENLWKICPNCERMIHHKDLIEKLHVCNHCNYHFRIEPKERLNILFGKDNYELISLEVHSDDPLKFKDKKRYIDRINEYRKKTQDNDAYILALGSLENKKILVGILNFNFMGGSMGRAVGYGIVQSAKKAAELNIPFIVFTASGGARMQEGIISLMQMPRTVAAVKILKDKKIPYITILTDPTTGGVTASFAMLGDITIAESGSTIGFAGKRVIQDTIREELPNNFQKSEYLKDHGMVDLVTNREDLKKNLSLIINHLDNK